MSEQSVTTAPTPAAGESAAELARRHGLQRIGQRPTLGRYIASVWGRRAFIVALSRSKAYAKQQNNYLGQLWTVLIPLLNAAVYFFIFGLVLKTQGTVENFPAFLVIGVFLYRFTTTSANSGARAIVKNLSLVRALHFPRACLPLVSALVELVALLPALVVLAGVCYLTGEPLAVKNLLLIPVVLLQTLFNAGLAFVLARWVAKVRDVINLIPFALRLMMYISGVFFPLTHYFPGALGEVLKWNPLYLYLSLGRSAMMSEFAIDPAQVAGGCVWAFGLFVFGFCYFWREEERYGRD